MHGACHGILACRPWLPAIRRRAHLPSPVLPLLGDLLLPHLAQLLNSRHGQLLTVGAAALFGISMVGGASAAAKSDNCVAIYSSGVQHNGTDPGNTLGEGNNPDRGENSGPNHGARGNEIKGLQDSCNNANGK